MATYKGGGREGSLEDTLTLIRGKHSLNITVSQGQLSEKCIVSVIIRAKIHIISKKFISYIAWNIDISNHFDVKIINAKFSF